MGHFKKKLELFGSQKMCKTIMLDNLDADDVDCMIRGQSQSLPYRERLGQFMQRISFDLKMFAITLKRTM
jgi:hypothetical protein